MAYIFQADIYCDHCGEGIQRDLIETGNAPPPEEREEDSDRFPQGPYRNGGGEADTPQHCAACREFLENPLTPDGMDYVQERADAAAKQYESDRGVTEGEYSWSDVAEYCASNGREALSQWITNYLAWGG